MTLTIHSRCKIQRFWVFGMRLSSTTFTYECIRKISHFECKRWSHSTKISTSANRSGAVDFSLQMSSDEHSIGFTVANGPINVPRHDSFIKNTHYFVRSQIVILNRQCISTHQTPTQITATERNLTVMSFRAVLYFSGNSAKESFKAMQWL